MQSGFGVLVWVVRRCGGAATLLLTCTLIGCVSPVAVGTGAAGVGLFHIEHRRLHPDVRYDRLRGVGLYVRNGNLGLGYCDAKTVHARLDDRDYLVHTPVGDLAVGDNAVATALPLITTASEPITPEITR